MERVDIFMHATMKKSILSNGTCKINASENRITATAGAYLEEITFNGWRPQPQLQESITIIELEEIDRNETHKKDPHVGQLHVCKHTHTGIKSSPTGQGGQEEDL